MSNLTLIAAIGKNNELGKDNTLIWHFKEDMKFFKDNTIGKPIIMGRKTLESLPKLLPNREHLVLTRSNLEIEGVKVFHSKEELYSYIEEYPKEYMVIGGASIYKEFMDDADKMLLTRINDTCDSADCYFPNIDESIWEEKVLDIKEEKGVSLKFLEYKRK